MSIDKELAKMGIINPKSVKRNLTVPELYEEIIRNDEAILASKGAVVVRSGKYTGRSPKFRFIVRQKPSEDLVWWGDINRDVDKEYFDLMYNKLVSYLQHRNVYVFDGYVGADERYRIPLRVITTTAWQSLFSRNMFVRETDPEKLKNFQPEFRIIAAPEFNSIPELDGSNGDAFILFNFEKKLLIIGGSGYGGEIKKAMFSTINFVMPQRGIMTMHASANIGKKGDTAVFFGLSGTGKTTLSSDPDRYLIGDDEHGWSDDGVFNFEGGCYAKVINLSQKDEPLIHAACQRFGAILENVIVDDKRDPDFFDGSITENTRASYPIDFIPNAELSGKGTHPQNIIMLTYDAFGVLPPVSRLTKEQAMFHFMSGYTAKVAGTEAGITEPQATFSTCFGAPFMVLRPSVYADMLGERIEKHNVKCWLVNTGNVGGGYGVGKRISISHTRAIISAILNGDLDDVEYDTLPYFNMRFPKRCPGVPPEVLDQKNSWKDKAAYEAALKKLAISFHENFKQFEEMAKGKVSNIQI